MVTEQKDLVRTIHDSASSLLVLINDVLDLAKVEAGRMTVERVPFDLRRVVQTAVEIVQYHAAEKSLCVEVSVAPDVPQGLAGDPDRLRQVLLNLLSNAVKFTVHGSVEVRVASRLLPDGEREITFTVRDTGVGISPESLGRLFTPFEQGDAAKRGHVGGTGLGLVISKRLVELMGGALRVESEVGRGSTFEFTIRGPAASAPVAAASGDVQPLVDSGRLRILLVEDNIINQRVALAMLGRLGCTADVAGNGVEAVAAVERKEYSLILMDLRMPEMDGFEAARRIVAARGEHRPRIAAMTASAFEEDRAACVAAGMEDFLSKPVHIDALRAVLSRAAAQGHLSRPAPAPAATSSGPPASLPTGVASDAHGGVVILAREALDHLRALDSPDAPGFFEDVCRQFVHDAGSRIDSLARAVSAGDARTAERETHSLKSMAGMFGATQMAARCAALEDSAHRADLSGHAEGVAALRADLDRVARALEIEAGGDLRAAG